jgi:hypothetical protein
MFLTPHQITEAPTFNQGRRNAASSWLSLCLPTVVNMGTALLAWLICFVTSIPATLGYWLIGASASDSIKLE